MEAQIGVDITMVTLPDKTKKQVLEVRNMYIKRGEESFTLNDVLVRAVDALYKIEMMQQKQLETKGGKDGRPESLGPSSRQG